MAQPITAITKIISTCLRESPPSGSTARMVGERIMMPYAVMSSTEKKQHPASRALCTRFLRRRAAHT